MKHSHNGVYSTVNRVLSGFRCPLLSPPLRARATAHPYNRHNNSCDLIPLSTWSHRHQQSLRLAGCRHGFMRQFLPHKTPNRVGGSLTHLNAPSSKTLWGFTGRLTRAVMEFRCQWTTPCQELAHTHPPTPYPCPLLSAIPSSLQKAAGFSKNGCLEMGSMYPPQMWLFAPPFKTSGCHLAPTGFSR